MKFRTDINGLRALAVIAVVLFHFNPSWAPGGFAGVDVFFVISGFLMTGIIFRGLKNNKFSIVNFYVARANRIIPALSVVCLALLVFGWFYLTPLDYLALGKHVASSMGFLSNVIYWRESGYFDAASHSKWLLHTWSLSVEWQFYMIYPVALVLLNKCIPLSNIKRLLVAATVIGFILSAYATYLWPDSAYFLLPTRAWEMMIGGLAFLYPLQNLKEARRKYLERVGIALILVSYASISKDNLWPGYLALIPAFGAYLVIIANRSNSIITDNVVMQKVGLWSYSIYLWHWPVVVFGYYFEIQHWEWIGIPVSVVLGFSSYKFVESIKFPTLSSISIKPIATFKPLWMVVSIGLAASTVYKFNGSNHISDTIPNGIYKSLSMFPQYPDYCHIWDKNINKINTDNFDCTLGNKSKDVVALLWGDSYAGALDPFVNNIFEEYSITSRTTSACFPSLSETLLGGSQPEYCKKIRTKIKSEIKDHKYDIVFLAGRWDLMFDSYGDEGIKSLFDAVDFASRNSKIVYLFEEPIRYKRNVSSDFIKGKYILGKKATFERDDANAKLVNNYIKNIYSKKMYKNVFLVRRDAMYGYSNNDDYMISGEPYTFDQGHLNILGSIQMAENFKRSKAYGPLYEYFNGKVTSNTSKKLEIRQGP